MCEEIHLALQMELPKLQVIGGLDATAGDRKRGVVGAWMLACHALCEDVCARWLMGRPCSWVVSVKEICAP